MSPKTYENQIKIGVAGVGHMGQYHTKLLADMLNRDNVYIFDADTDRCKEIAKKYEINACSDYSRMLDSVDAVIIAVPTCFHYEYSMEALKKGKHVLVEKPISDNIKHAREMVEYAEAHNLVLHVGR